MGYSFKTYKYYTKGKERLTLYGTTLPDQNMVLITAIKCSKRDVFKKKESDGWLDELLKKGNPKSDPHDFSEGITQVLIPIINNRPKNTFFSYADRMYCRKYVSIVKTFVTRIEYLTKEEDSKYDYQFQ